LSDLILRGVSRSYAPGAPALAPFDLAVRSGELIVLVGPSGCGKSTLLKLIAGLEPADAGRIALGGRDITRAEPRDRRIAMVFQNYALYPHLSVAENLAYPLRRARVSRAEIAAKVSATAAQLRLEPYLDRRPAQLSGGQKQRVAMGRAMIREPDLFLLDEPLSNLDAALRAHVRAEIAELQRRLGVTMLYVTHDQVEAQTLADRVVVLRDGAVQQVGPPREVHARPANLFVASFLAVVPPNVAPGRIVDGTLDLGAMQVALDDLPDEMAAALAGRDEVYVAIRPEALSPAGPADPAVLCARARRREFVGRTQQVQLEARRLPDLPGRLERLTGRRDHETMLWIADDRSREDALRLACRPEELMLFDLDGAALGPHGGGLV